MLVCLWCVSCVVLYSIDKPLLSVLSSRSINNSCRQSRSVSRPSSVETHRLWLMRRSSMPCRATMRFTLPYHTLINNCHKYPSYHWKMCNTRLEWHVLHYVRLCYVARCVCFFFKTQDDISFFLRSKAREQGTAVAHRDKICMMCNDFFWSYCTYFRWISWNSQGKLGNTVGKMDQCLPLLTGIFFRLRLITLSGAFLHRYFHCYLR